MFHIRQNNHRGGVAFTLHSLQTHTCKNTTAWHYNSWTHVSTQWVEQFHSSALTSSFVDLQSSLMNMDGAFRKIYCCSILNAIFPLEWIQANCFISITGKRNPVIQAESETCVIMLWINCHSTCRAVGVSPRSLMTLGWSNSFMQAASRRKSSISERVQMATRDETSGIRCGNGKVRQGWAAVRLTNQPLNQEVFLTC